jgi:pyruvyl transferase EpsO
MKQRDLLFEHLATNRLTRGLNLLSSASFVITDRLHCHILCVLLGIPHIAFDNSYGKLSTFIDAWTKDSGLVQVVPSLDRAIELWSESETGSGEPTKP